MYLKLLAREAISLDFASKCRSFSVRVEGANSGEEDGKKDTD